MRNQSGQSLIQVMISVAIMGVVMTAMTSMINSLTNETKSMTEKLGVLDLEKLLIASLADGSACLYALNNSSPPVTFNANTAMSPTSPLVLTLPSTPANPARLYASYNASATPPLGPVVVQVGGQAAAYSSSLSVSAINLELTGLNIAGTSANVVGRWRIDFDNARMARALKPAYVTVALRANVTNPAAATFTSCQVTSSGAPAGGGSGEWCGAFIGSDVYVTGPGIHTVVEECQGKAVTCAPGHTVNGTFCMSGVFVAGKDLNSACPPTHTIKKILEAVESITTDPISGSTTINKAFLYTCMPN